MKVADKNPDRWLIDDLEWALLDFKIHPLLGQVATIKAIARHLRNRVPDGLLEPLESIFTKLMNEAAEIVSPDRPGPRPAPLDTRMVEAYARLQHYDLNSSAKFYTYARTCVSNAVMRQAKALRSVVRRPLKHPARYDLSIAPTKPDPHDFRDYVGSRANFTVSDDPEDDAGGQGRRASHSRLRPPPQEPEIVFGESPRHGLSS